MSSCERERSEKMIQSKRRGRKLVQSIIIHQNRRLISKVQNIRDCMHLGWYDVLSHLYETGRAGWLAGWLAGVAL